MKVLSCSFSARVWLLDAIQDFYFIRTEMLIFFLLEGILLWKGFLANPVAYLQFFTCDILNNSEALPIGYIFPINRNMIYLEK